LKEVIMKLRLFLGLAVLCLVPLVSHAGPVQFTYESTLGTPGNTGAVLFGKRVLDPNGTGYLDPTPDIPVQPWFEPSRYGAGDPFGTSGAVGPRNLWSSSVIGLAVLEAVHTDPIPTGRPISDKVAFTFKLTDYESGQSEKVSLEGQYVVTYETNTNGGYEPVFLDLLFPKYNDYQWNLGNYQYDVSLFPAKGDGTSPANYDALWANVSVRRMTNGNTGTDGPLPDSGGGIPGVPEPATCLMGLIGLASLGVFRGRFKASQVK
jgi:hypothetical protein